MNVHVCVWAGSEATGKVKVSTLNLVDLAGSERADKAATTGTHLKEVRNNFDGWGVGGECAGDGWMGAGIQREGDRDSEGRGPCTCG